MTFLNIGFGNLVSSERIISILTPDSSPMKRLVRQGKTKNSLIDASCGRKTQAIIVMDTGHIVLSALTSETLLNKLVKNDN